MDNFEGVLGVLNSEKVALAAGFAAGFLYTFKFTKKTLDKPLKSIFCATVDGLVLSGGVALILYFLPEKFRFIIPITCAASCIFWKYKDLFGPRNPRTKNRINNSIRD